MIEPQMSVVVPVYSVEKEYFEECILSLKQQTLEAIEIIIVADGVKKEILDLCKSFEGQDERIRVVEQENQGVAVARNNGILNAKAPYITFVDADDWVEPEFCAFFYDNFKNNPDVQIISSAAYINKNDEEIENPFWNGEKKYFTGKEKEEMELQAIFKEAASYVPRFATFGTTWAKAYDVEWLRKQNIIYEPELRRGQDTVFNLHAFETAEKVLYVKRFLYHYRMNSGSTVNKYTEGTIDILERISRYILKFIKEHGKDERFYQAYNNKSIQLLSQSINSDYAHKNNPKNYLTRRKELKTALRRKCYRDNFKNINTENIPVTRKLYWSLMKYRMVDLIYLAHWVYRKNN